MHVPTEIRNRVVEKLQEGIAITKEKYGIAIAMPSISYDLRGTTAGRANYGRWTVEFNPVLLMQNIETFIARTVPHELAHLITDKVHPSAHRRGWTGKRSVHGPEWQSVMRALGVEDISRCHQYDVTDAKVRTSAKPSFKYLCTGCKRVFDLGPKRHKNMLSNYRSYHHCSGHALKFTGDVVVPNKIAVVPTVAPVTTPSSGSKLDICRSLYAAHHTTIDRQGMIQLFIQQAKCTPAGASTYYATCKKG